MLIEPSMWEETYKVHSFLTDRYCRLSVPAISQLFQETAEAHTSAYNMGYHSLIAQGKAWVLLRVYYEISAYPSIYENISMRTWSRGYKGPIAFRDFEIRNSAGEIVIKGTSTWCIIDINSRMPQRCNKIMDSFPMHEHTAVAKEIGKLLPSVEGEVVNSFKSPFMAIDKAQHTNNAMYMRWVMNALEENDQKRNIRSVDISYVRETPMNDLITIKRHRPSPNEYNFVLENSRGLSMICNLIFE